MQRAMLSSPPGMAPRRWPNASAPRASSCNHWPAPGAAFSPITRLRRSNSTASGISTTPIWCAEFASENWVALHHVDVVRDMAAAKLSFAGSSTLANNFPLFSIPGCRHALPVGRGSGDAR